MTVQVAPRRLAVHQQHRGAGAQAAAQPQLGVEGLGDAARIGQDLMAGTAEKLFHGALEGARGALVGQVHLGCPPAHRHAHGAAPVHDHGESELASEERRNFLKLAGTGSFTAAGCGWPPAPV